MMAPPVVSLRPGPSVDGVVCFAFRRRHGLAPLLLARVMSVGHLLVQTIDLSVQRLKALARMVVVSAVR